MGKWENTNRKPKQKTVKNTRNTHRQTTNCFYKDIFD